MIFSQGQMLNSLSKRYLKKKIGFLQLCKSIVQARCASLLLSDYVIWLENREMSRDIISSSSVQDKKLESKYGYIISDEQN